MIICHIINSLNNGGAENILLKLSKHSNKKVYKHHVISLIANGDLIKKFESECEKVHVLNFKKNIFFIIEIFRLYKLVKKIKPNIIIGWMYHSILLTSLIGKILKISNIYWNIRHTELIFFKSSFITILIAKILAYISNKIPNKIIYCSEESKDFHNKFGFSKENSIIINNGVDINLFQYSENKKYEIRKKLSIPDEYFTIGMFANYRLQKNHKLFFDSLNIFNKKKLPFKVLMAGRNIDKKNKHLYSQIKNNNLENNIILLGNIDNIYEIYNCLDIFVLTSNFGESFSNVLIESMSSSVPCITTNIGASAFIVNKSGWVLKEFNKYKLSDLLSHVYHLKLNKKKWDDIINQNRLRVEKNFTLKIMIDKYEKIWNIS